MSVGSPLMNILFARILSESAGTTKVETASIGSIRHKGLLSMRLETTGEHFVELVGNFHAQGIELVVEVGCIVEIELVATRCVPEDETFGVHEVEMNDGEAIVLVDPYGHERFSWRSPWCGPGGWRARSVYWSCPGWRSGRRPGLEGTG